jgi:3-isopropylmalate/(R)-2-methylmalate dehydratase small subunit
MDKFTRLDSVAIPLLESDIDTDVIFPARFLLLLDRKGLGKYLFHGRREDQAVAGGFVLDRPEYNGAAILVGGERFGVGSSREHAVWALADHGIRCIIAPSFGDIFHANCLKNGVLPIRLAPPDHQRVAEAATAADPVIIDLPGQSIRLHQGPAIAFEIDPRSKQALLKGLDEIDLILTEDTQAISEFEARQKEQSPWLWREAGTLDGIGQPDPPGDTEQGL